MLHVRHFTMHVHRAVQVVTRPLNCGNSVRVPLRADLRIASVRERRPATSSAARTAAPVIVAAARAGIVRQRPLSCAVGNAVQRFERK